MVPYEHVDEPEDEYLALVLAADLALIDAADRLRRHWAAHAQTVGLTAIQAKVLLRLDPGHAIPMRRLARDLDYDASNLTTLVDRLAGRGALERQADPDDRRVKALVLTAEGERLRRQFWRGLVADAGPLAPLRETDLRRLHRLLGRITGPS